MRAIVLAAGCGTRLHPLTDSVHKCMLPYEGTPVIQRLVAQLKQVGIHEVIIVIGHKKEMIIKELERFDGIQFVENKRYLEDVNILSMLLATQAATKTNPDDTLVFEADMLFENELVNYVMGADFEDKSVWFTSGKFTRNQRGGILKTDGFGNIIDIQIVDSFKAEHEGYEKLTGIMRISREALLEFGRLLNQYAKSTLKQYYLQPWIEHLADLPCIKGDASHYKFATFNTVSDYDQVQHIQFDQPAEERKIELIKTQQLKPIELFEKKRLDVVYNHVVRNEIWTQPLKIEKKHLLVLDGHHRLALAKNLGFQFIPTIGFDYKDVEMWSLREELYLDKERVIAHATQGKVFPYKTVKHKFPNVTCLCNLKLKELKCD